MTKCLPAERFSNGHTDSINMLLYSHAKNIHEYHNGHSTENETHQIRGTSFIGTSYISVVCLSSENAFGDYY